MALFRPDRRSGERAGDTDRRRFPRPALWFNLTILLVAVAGIAFARFHREWVHRQYADVLMEQERTPEQVNRLKEELAEMDLSREELEAELDSRMQFLENVKSDDFYLSVDTEAKKLRFHYADAVLREADILVGQEAHVRSPDGKTAWTFVPVKGAFRIEGKVAGHRWRIPEWVYAMRNEPPPSERPTIRHGLGQFVIQLPHGYVIHTPPAEESPLDGPKPGSIMVADEEAIRAIWPRIHKQTKVYIF
ncbi:MAG: L,D-transpeptidase [Thermoanaerobaculia bacterium]